MFRSFLDWFRLKFRIDHVISQVGAMDRKIELVNQKSEHDLAYLKKRSDDLQALLVKTTAEFARVQQAIEAAQVTIRKQAETMDAMQDQLRTARDITIPGLVASHQVMTNRCLADAAIHSARSVLNTSGKGYAE